MHIIEIQVQPFHLYIRHQIVSYKLEYSPSYFCNLLRNLGKPKTQLNTKTKTKIYLQFRYINNNPDNPLMKNSNYLLNHYIDLCKLSTNLRTNFYNVHVKLKSKKPFFHKKQTPPLSLCTLRIYNIIIVTCIIFLYPLKITYHVLFYVYPFLRTIPMFKHSL